jgi:catechol 2,3-dioxygenase
MASSSFFRNVCPSDALLRVRSLAGTIGFYRDVLGMRVITLDGRRAELSATGDLPALLVLEERAEAPPRARGAPGLFHLAFLFSDRLALATATRRLLQVRHFLQGGLGSRGE